MVQTGLNSSAEYTGEEYSESSFGGFGDYMRRKKLKLQNQDEAIRNEIKDEQPIFKGMVIHVLPPPLPL
jgi:DNA repair protein REV1